MMSSRSLKFALLFGLLFIIGCATSRTEENATIYTMDMTSILLNLVGIIAAFGYGIYKFMNKSIIQGIVGVAGGLILTSMIIGMVGDKLTVTPDEFDLVRKGIGASNSAHLRYDDIQQAAISMELSRGRRGREKKNYYLNCNLKSGEQKSIPIGTLMEAGLEEILGHMADHRIPIENLTGE